MSTVTVRRLARKPRRCEGCDAPGIHVGDVYLEHTTFPGYGDGAGYATDAGRPVRMAECASCACRYGRVHALGDVPVEQVYRMGLA